MHFGLANKQVPFCATLGVLFLSARRAHDWLIKRAQAASSIRGFAGALAAPAGGQRKLASRERARQRPEVAARHTRAESRAGERDAQTRRCRVCHWRVRLGLGRLQMLRNSARSKPKPNSNSDGNSNFNSNSNSNSTAISLVGRAAKLIGRASGRLAQLSAGD